MSAVRHNVAEITRGRAAHTGFALPVALQMLHCRGGSLSRAHSVGRPPCTQRQCVTTRELFIWVDVILLQVALASIPLFLPHRDTSFLPAYIGEAGRLRRNCCAIVGGLSRAGGDAGWCSVSCLERSSWLWTLRRISGGAILDIT